jgi:hypothetical protein
MDSRPYSNQSYDECISLQHPWITCDEYTTIPKAATNGLFNWTYNDEHMMKNHRQMEPDDDERVMNWTWQWLSGTYDGPQIGWGKPLGQALGQAQSDRLSCLCWYWPSHIYVHACIYIYMYIHTYMYMCIIVHICTCIQLYIYYTSMYITIIVLLLLIIITIIILVIIIYIHISIRTWI